MNDIRNTLDVYERETDHDREREKRLATPEQIDGEARWATIREARETVIRGALRVCASRLSRNLTQEARAKSLLNDGFHRWRQAVDRPVGPVAGRRKRAEVDKWFKEKG